MSARHENLPKATRREWIGLAVLSLPCVLYSMDLSVLNLAVPQLTVDLQPSASQLLWIVDIYGFLLAGFLITMGTLGDRIGRRRLLLIGAAAFGATSVLAAFANSAETLIAARALLGIAAATLAPSTLSLIRNMFLDEHQRTLAIGIWVGSFSAGGAIGPVIGGVLLEHFWWGSVFLLAVPIMALLLIIGPMLLPEFRDEHAGRLDLVSAGMSTSGVLAVIYGVKRIAEAGLHANAVFMILLGVAIAVLFVRRQKRLPDPLIDVRLFRSRVIAAALSINIMALFIAFGSFLFIAQYLQLVLGMSPLEAGLWSAPSGIVFVVGSAVTPFAVRRFGPATVMSGGLLICAVGFAFLTQTALRDEIWIFMTGFLLMCLGLAPVGTVSTDLVMGTAPPERAGAASGVSETSFEFGGALGIAVLGSIITALYRTQMSHAALEGIDTASIEVARDTLGAAVGTAMQLQGEQREALLWTARNAFMESFRITSAICVAISIVAAIVAMVVIRRQAAYVGTQESSKIPTSLQNETGPQIAD